MKFGYKDLEAWNKAVEVIKLVENISTGNIIDYLNK